ncbi:Protein SRC2-like protein [Bienertia sinuspersici]
MEPLSQSSKYCYDPENDTVFSGKLEVFIHHARNIHNICIYVDQDVYAKFSLTYNPDEMVSTRVVVGGGKNPDFEEKLELKVKQIDSVLKCEIWMLSRVKNLLDDQLLGFALVPISDIINQRGEISCQDFSLSSTDLFHSPAGTVQLSLSLSSNFSSVFSLNSSDNTFSGISSISSEVVLLNPNDYSRVEFPDMNAATEDQIMVSEYFNSGNNTSSLGSFLHLGSYLKTESDCEMIGNSSEENENCPSESNQQSGVSSSTTSQSDYRNTAQSNSVNNDHKQGQAQTGEKQSKVIGDTDNGIEEKRVIVNEIEDKQSTMQKQIADMYMKSMQQFTESLANMKLPMGLDPKINTEDPRNVIRVMEQSNGSDLENKKDGSRVFYGSRAFF